MDEDEKILEEIIERSKNKIKNEYFKIVFDGTQYNIKQFFGILKPSSKMMEDGWHRHSYLTKYITDEYPIFDLHDFKSEDGVGIIKKNENDKLKDELLEYVKYMEMNKEIPTIIKSLKKILNIFNIDFMKFTSFKDLNESSFNIISNSSIVEKPKLLMKYVNLINDLFLNIEKLNLDNYRTLLNEKFKCFFILV